MSKNDEKILSLLGLAYRARKVALGETIIKDMQKGKMKCVLVAEDASHNTKKKLINKGEFYNVPVYIFSDVEHLSNAIGKQNRVSVGIIDRGFADKIKNMIGG